jgi:P-type conjugative transfer protein TrbJ
MTQRRLCRSRCYAVTIRILACGLAGVSGLGVTSRAAAQFTVFDPSNYSQNLLTAARSLQQINHQIQSLQNEATMLINQAKNLARIDFPELDALRRTLQQVDHLMIQAQRVGFNVDTIDSQFRQLFPQRFDEMKSADGRVLDAEARLDASMTAFDQTMQMQAQVVGNVAADNTALAAIVARSQGAEGGLQAQQATNQLLTLAAKQAFQIQTMMAAQYRAQALESARRVQAENDARGATAKFLGDGTAYHPH